MQIVVLCIILRNIVDCSEIVDTTFLFLSGFLYTVNSNFFCFK